MKKNFLFITLLLVALIALMTLSSCGLNDDGGSQTDDSGDKTDDNGDQTDDKDHTLCAIVESFKTDATCTEDGVRVTKCECGVELSESIPAKGHSFLNGYCQNEGCSAVCPHNFDQSFKCTVCGYAKPKTDIIFQIQHTSGTALGSTAQRLMAGEDPEAFQEIDVLVQNRNTAAEAASNTRVKYEYSNHASASNIETLVFSGSSLAPDVFSSNVTTMTSASLMGCFANLYANTELCTKTFGDGKNSFAFTKDGYDGSAADQFDLNAGEGYFYDYMQSLALTNSDGTRNKMYLIASNYNIDFIRSMEVIPVNVKMLEGIEGSGGLEGLYERVWNGTWSYDTLISLSSAVYRDANDNKISDIEDTLGFCISTYTAAAFTGMLYSSSAKIINHGMTDGSYSYSYPLSSGDLEALSTAFYELLYNTEGITVISDASDLYQIADRFADNKLLFGGISEIGYLEMTDYQTTSGGFGFVPVPAVKLGAETPDYSTTVYYNGNLIAISASTKEFEECTAFLNYVSTSSEEIVKKYAETYLSGALYKSAPEGCPNAKMFAFIKNHVKDGFEYTYDMAVVNYLPYMNRAAFTWHYLLYNSLKLDIMAMKYSEVFMDKYNELSSIHDDWNRLK